MKTKVNLYSRHPKGRIDTFQFTPYRNTTLVDRESKTSLAYSVNPNQARLLLEAIRENGRRRLSTACISRLASFVAEAWESDPTQDTVSQLTKLMSNLLDTTLLCPNDSLDDALEQFCRNNVPTHTVSPTITLLIAVSYIDRLKQKYHNIKGTSGCGNRLVLVAYMMAAKYMHANLRSLIHVASPQPISTTPLPSPPTSPTDTNPLSYHYFSSSHSRSKKPVYSDYHYHILRMELEFLHFLNYDLSIQNAFRLIRWAQKLDDVVLPPIRNQQKQTEYTSADEADDES